MDVTDCPGECAINGDCGSEAECDMQIYLVLIGLSVFAVIASIVGICIWVKSCKKHKTKLAEKNSHKEPLVNNDAEQCESNYEMTPQGQAQQYQ